MLKNINIICLLLLVFYSFPALAEKKKPPEMGMSKKIERVKDSDIRIVSTEDLSKAFKGRIKMVIIDVRDYKDFNKVHIQGATNIPVEAISAHSLRRAAPLKSDKIIFYCEDNECPDSLTAAQKAVIFGYKFVYRYVAGFKHWYEYGYPVTVVKK